MAEHERNQEPSKSLLIDALMHLRFEALAFFDRPNHVVWVVRQSGRTVDNAFEYRDWRQIRRRGDREIAGAARQQSPERQVNWLLDLEPKQGSPHARRHDAALDSQEPKEPTGLFGGVAARLKRFAKVPEHPQPGVGCEAERGSQTHDRAAGHPLRDDRVALEQVDELARRIAVAHPSVEHD
jgi:hypothetical protein